MVARARVSRRIRRVAIVGAGAWGTALAQVAARAGLATTLIARDAAAAAALGRTRRNPDRLGDVELEARILPSADPTECAAADLVILAVPAQATAAALAPLPPALPAILLVAKGLDAVTGRRLSEVARAVQPGLALAVLSGPSFAWEVARGLPAALVLASEQNALGERIAQALGQPHFRLYWTEDVLGVELGGAVKNVLAIAAGIAIGHGLGENARAGLITRGLAEMVRLGEALGARRETLTGLSGLGDLVLTATSARSRNYALGLEIGRSATDRSPTARRPLAEGAHTAAALAALADRHAVDMPIAAAVAGVLAGACGVETAMQRLLTRPFRPEIA